MKQDIYSLDWHRSIMKNVGRSKVLLLSNTGVVSTAIVPQDGSADKYGITAYGLLDGRVNGSWPTLQSFSDALHANKNIKAFGCERLCCIPDCDELPMLDFLDCCAILRVLPNLAFCWHHQDPYAPAKYLASHYGSLMFCNVNRQNIEDFDYDLVKHKEFYAVDLYMSEYDGGCCNG